MKKLNFINNMKKIIIIGVIVSLGLIAFAAFRDKSEDDTVVKIGYLETIATAPLYIAQDKNYFADEGLKNVEFIKLSSANEAYEALVRGDVDFVPGTGLLQVLINQQKVGDAVKIASMSAFTDDTNFDKLITLDNKSVDTLKDLEGKNIAVFPGTTPTTFLKLFLKKNSINVENITFVQLLPQNQIQALEAGSVDAIFGYQPIPALAEAKLANVKTLAENLFITLYPNIPLGSRLATKEFMCTRTKEFKKVQKAIDKGQDIITSDKKLYASILGGRINIPAAIVEKINPYLTYPAQADAISKFQNFLIVNGELKEMADINKVVGCQ